jgi:hypothetical protein
VSCLTEAFGPFRIDDASCEIVGVDDALRDAGVAVASESYIDQLNIAVDIDPSSVTGPSPRLADPYRVDPGGCGNDYGWYVEPGPPPRVHLCPRSCASLPANTTADALLGCDSLWREL